MLKLIRHTRNQPLNFNVGVAKVFQHPFCYKKKQVLNLISRLLVSLIVLSGPEVLSHVYLMFKKNSLLDKTGIEPAGNLGVFQDFAILPFHMSTLPHFVYFILFHFFSCFWLRSILKSAWEEPLGHKKYRNIFSDICLYQMLQITVLHEPTSLTWPRIFLITLIVFCFAPL